MKDYNLIPAANFAEYDDQTAGDPSIWNEFAAAAFRVGHSQITDQFRYCKMLSNYDDILISFSPINSLYDANDQLLPDESYLLSSYFFDSSLLTEPGFIDNSIRGRTKQVPFSINPEYSDQMTDLLFKLAV